MSYSVLKKFKKQEERKFEEKYARHIVYGQDLYSLLVFEDLCVKHGAENVRLITNSQIDAKDIRNNGPSVFRGEKNLQIFKKYILNSETSYSGTPIYFKDLSLKKFGGRGKPQPLMAGEDFFTMPSFEVDFDHYIERAINALSAYSDSIESQRLVGIETDTPSDLVEPSHFKLVCGNDTIYRCDQLHFGYNPFVFYTLFEDKPSLSNEFIEYCESVNGPWTLTVHLKFQSQITEVKETVFLPLSYTHDWGHFIGEFARASEETGKSQEASFIYFVDQEHVNEEEVSRRIRLLKKQIVKAFPDAKDVKFEEYVSLKENTPSSSFREFDLGSGDHFPNNLSFFGVNAPLGNEFSDEEIINLSGNCSHATRALASLRSENINL